MERFLKVEKDPSNEIQKCYFKNWSLKGSLGNHTWLFYGIITKTLFGIFILGFYGSMKNLSNP